MADRRDYVALEWVKGEIEETLKQARYALEAFVEFPDDINKLEFSLAYLHQVYGTLQMVEFFGAALLAEEMEALNQSMLDGITPKSNENLSVLMQAIIQLPSYLEQIKQGQYDLPIVLLPLLNDLRAARGESLFSETSLFTPDLSPAKIVTDEGDYSEFESEKTSKLLSKLRQMYQLALIGWMKDKDTKANLQYLIKVIHRVETITQGTSIHPYWEIVVAFITALEHDLIERTPATGHVLREIEHGLKILQKKPTIYVKQVPTDIQLKNILYYIAKLGETDLPIITDVQQRYNLLESLPSSQIIEDQRSLLAGPDKETVNNVASALLEELSRSKDSLDLMVRTQVKDAQQISTLLPPLQQLSNTMSVVGLNNPKKVLDEQLLIIKKIQQKSLLLDDGLLMDIAGALLYIEATLSGIVADSSLNLADARPTIDINNANEALLREARTGIEQVKDSIIEFIGAHFNPEILVNTPTILSAVCGGLTMIPLHSASHILKAVQNYIEVKFLEENYKPEWHEMDSLADALVGVEYYLERLARDGTQANTDILERASLSLQALGVTLPLESHEDAIPTDEDVTESSEAVSRIETASYDTENQGPVDNILNTVDENDTFDEHYHTQALNDESSLDSNENQILSEGETVTTVNLREESNSIEESQKNNDEQIGSVKNLDVDPEILAIFLEEADEVQTELKSNFQAFQNDPTNRAALLACQRGFHTLKGSSRMVNAEFIGEVSWSFENMINCYVDGMLELSENFSRVIEIVLDCLPDLINKFKQGVVEKNAYISNLVHIVHCITQNKEFDWDILSAEAKDVKSDASEITTSEKSDIGENLQSVFRIELSSHLTYIHTFLSSYQLESEFPDLLQSTLHTMKGSSHMAGMNIIADLVVPLEKVTKDIQEHTTKPTQEYLDLLKELYDLVIEYSEYEPNVHPLPIKVSDYIEKVLKFQENYLEHSHLSSNSEEHKNIMSMFLIESMDIIMNSKETLDRWKETRHSSKHAINSLTEELDILSEAANSIGLEALSQLSTQLRMLYITAELDANIIGDSFFELAEQGHESLISMMDVLAAGQSLSVDAEFSQKLYELFEQLEIDIERINYLSRSGQPLETKKANNTLDKSTNDSEEPEILDTTDPLNEGIDESDNLVETQIKSSEPLDIAQVEQGKHSSSKLFAISGDFEVVSIFLEEAHDILDTIQQSFDDWISDKENIEKMESLQRDLHTLKGGARMAEIMPLGDLTHELEFIYEGLSQKKYTYSDSLSQLLQAGLDKIASMIVTIENEGVCEYANHLIGEIEKYRINPDNYAFDSVHLNYKVVVNDSNNEVLNSNGTSESVLEIESSSEDQNALESIEYPNQSNDSLDYDILDIFTDEASELLNELESAIDSWKKDSKNETFGDQVKRILHTLKGGARLAKLTDLAKLTHDFETFIVHAQQNKLSLDTDFFNDILNRQDQLIQLIEKLQLQLSNVGRQEFEELSSNLFEIDATKATTDATTQLNDGQATPIITSDGVSLSTMENENQPDFQNLKADTESPKETPQSQNIKSQTNETVKVNASLLEDLVNLAGETSISRSRLEQEISDFNYTLSDMDQALERLRDQVRRLDMETEAQILFRQEQVGGYEDFDPLELDRYSHIQQLSRSLLEVSYDLQELKNNLSEKHRDAEALLLQQSRINTELQEGLMRTRMVPFSRLLPRLRRIVRQVASNLNKKVELVIGNAEGEIDRTILERMISPLEHLLRNAVDHGIETPEVRKQKGKSEVGIINLTINREGGEIVIRLSDDGKGIDAEAIRKQAIAKDFLTADTPLEDNEVIQFILEAGFSTAEKVTQISGRGVGMDVVNTQVKQLSGNLSIQSDHGKGTQFIIRLPFTVSVNRALMINVHDDLYALPLTSIGGIVRVTPDQLKGYYADNAKVFEYNGKEYLLEYMGKLLRTSDTANLAHVEHSIPLILINGSEGYPSMALHVDSLMGSREIVVKTLGSHFNKLPGVSGATILGDGSVVIILDLAALIRSEYSGVTLNSEDRTSHNGLNYFQSSKMLRVMVCDDSVTVRKVTSRLLERNGMEVILAKHGVDAMTKLLDVKPDLILLDIEMPHMDGFEVASAIRHDENLKDIPIIMVTSRTGEKHRSRAFSLGVNAYLGKPFQEGILLDTIKEYI